MPPAGLEARAVEISTLARLSHELFTAPEVGRLLADAEREARDDDERALLRETRHLYERATRVPQALVARLSAATARALPVWAEARATSDFQRFAPALSELVALRREYAEHVDPEADPYEVLFADHEPWIPLAEARRALEALAARLTPLVPKAVERTREWSQDLGGPFAAEDQMRACQRVLDLLGYDRTRGRLDVSAHPFSTGNVHDARITTRFDPRDPLSAVFSVVHEFGHALYTLGLPAEHFGTPLGDARDLVVHESQSRLWENHVARSQAFWECALPTVREALGLRAQVDAPRVFQAANRVRPSFIRVEADELTYHVHIAVRLQVETALFDADLPVKEVPSVWNEAVAAGLGMTPPDDARGCLQDVHWSHGAFGYFPTYSLGSMLAAQLFDAFSRGHGGAGAVDDDLREGRFTPLTQWLRERVHRHGKRQTTPELIRHATGGTLGPDAFVAYARRKWGI